MDKMNIYYRKDGRFEGGLYETDGKPVTDFD